LKRSLIVNVPTGRIAAPGVMSLRNSAAFEHWRV